MVVYADNCTVTNNLRGEIVETDNLSEVFVLVPSNIIGMMCGVKYAQQSPNNKVTLFYYDSTTETATLDYRIAGQENFFAIVSDVQSKRN